MGSHKEMSGSIVSLEDELEAQEKGYTVIKRSGAMVPFRKERIKKAITAAFRDTYKIEEALPLSSDFLAAIDEICSLVIHDAFSTADEGEALTVEGIQDLVELKLMEKGFHEVAKDYILYRQHHKKLRDEALHNLKILRRDNSFVRFNPMKIALDIESAFRLSLTILGALPDEIIDAINSTTMRVIEASKRLSKEGNILSVDLIQDLVEEELMKGGHFKIAKDYIFSRISSVEDRERQKKPPIPTRKEEAISEEKGFLVQGKEQTFTLNRSELKKRIALASKGFEKVVSVDELLESTLSNFYEGIKEEEVDAALIMAARAKVEKEPPYAFVAGRLLLDCLYRETILVDNSHPKFKEITQSYFKETLKRAVSLKLLAPELLSFDLDKLAEAIDVNRDLQFSYIGLQTLYDRYFLVSEGKRLETPQTFWMRVAMGLAINEGSEKERWAIEFYNTLSQFLFISSTPTLFNSGTTHPQLSSCYLSTVMDDLVHIFKVISDDARLSKWAGGIGNDWTNIRATGAFIHGTNGQSQGVIPFLKVANDTAVAVNQGGKRKGAMCAYLETWHLDIEEFCELRKNTGDERRRTHDMNTAHWIPDLFMKRVMENGHWTLFSPDDVPDLHDLYGKAFERRYVEYEAMTERGEITHFKKMEAAILWRKMLSMLFETGHPWITFKDPSNIRSPEDHTGVVHSSNLCTEILLNTSAEETAVCNLGSINLLAHMSEKGIDEKRLSTTIKTAVRMLDNVIDINFYPTDEAKRANLRHRPIGLGIMGFQDALYHLKISYASFEAVEFADVSMEMITYYALLASSELARERGTYATYKGSKWDRGLLPIDTIALLANERGKELVEMDTTTRMDWNKVRESIKRFGMRNSNTCAIAPTATIGNICGVTQSIEPMYKHLFVKSNLSGEFTVLNPFLVAKLQELNLWDSQMVDDLKYFDGSIQEIARIPEEVKQLFLTAFEIEPDWLIECASRRQKWLDMGQSLNLYIAEPSGKKLSEMYLLAWKKGLKTTYYLRSQAATRVEKSTTDINVRGLQPRWMKNASPSSRIKVEREEKKSCSLDGGPCESCQ